MNFDFITLGNTLLSGSSEGVLYAILALGIFITFRILDFPDMTVDGSFAFGNCVAAVFISLGHPILALFAALAAGGAAGLGTGLLHTKLKIPSILAGILIMLSLYSINMRVLSGSSTLSLYGDKTVMTMLQDKTGLNSMWSSFIIGLFFCIILVAILYLFFGTEIGSALRATGDNEYMVRALGQNTDTTKVYAIIICNALVGLSGGVIAESNGYGDVGMGAGTIVIGLASIVIGEVVMGNRFNFAYRLAAIVVGAVIYRVIIALVIQYTPINTTDLKLFQSITVAILLGLQYILKRNRKVG